MLNDENQEDKAPRSIDDTMRDTMASIKARDTAPAEPAPDPAPAEKTDTPAPDAKPDVPAQPNKDPITGKFKPKAKPDALSAAQPKNTPDTVDPAQEGTAPQVAQQPKAASQAPSSWSPAAKAQWDALPPSIRTEVLKRESDAQRGIQQYAEKAKRLDAIDAVVQPHQRQQLTGNYGSFENGIKELLALSDFAGKSPYEFVAFFSQQRGLDLNQIANHLQRGGQAQPAQQPQLPTPQAAPNPLEARLAALESGIQRSQTQTIEATIKSFATEADASGELAHPYFEELRPDIALHLEAGKNLQEAYDAAVWASPAHREQLLESQRLQTEAANKVLAEKQAKEARQAATVVNVTRPNAGSTPTKPTSWEDTLKANHKRIMQGSAA